MNKFNKLNWRLQLYFCAEDHEEFGEPRGVCGPGWRGDEIAVGDGFGHGEIDVGAPGLGDVGADGGISAALFSLENVSGGEDLRCMADGGDGFVGFREVVNDFDDARDKTNIFGSAAAGQDESVVVFELDLVKGGVQREIMAALLGVGM